VRRTGYHRHGVALKGLKKYEEALATLRAGQRVDFNNADLNRLVTEIEPLQARAEQAKRSGMNPAELLKERGNDAFKSAAFEKAIELYGEAIEACSDKPGSALALSCYNNRAACNQQLSNFSGVIRDCTHVLEYDEKNQPALLRRALAYEGLERYRLALQDIRALLAINPTIDVRPVCPELVCSGILTSFCLSRLPTRPSTVSATTCASSSRTTDCTEHRTPPRQPSRGASS
jgi:stress-induced-phosphoprotein 1